MRVTKPQMRALKAIADARDPLEDGVLLLHCLPFRTVHAYTVVGSLSEKGLISQSGDGGSYLRHTESGRDVAAARDCRGPDHAPRARKGDVQRTRVSVQAELCGNGC